MLMLYVLVSAKHINAACSKRPMSSQRCRDYSIGCCLFVVLLTGSCSALLQIVLELLMQTLFVLMLFTLVLMPCTVGPAGG